MQTNNPETSKDYPSLLAQYTERYGNRDLADIAARYKQGLKMQKPDLLNLKRLSEEFPIAKGILTELAQKAESKEGVVDSSRQQAVKVFNVDLDNNQLTLDLEGKRPEAVAENPAEAAQATREYFEASIGLTGEQLDLLRKDYNAHKAEIEKGHWDMADYVLSNSKSISSIKDLSERSAKKREEKDRLISLMKAA